jgi:hypothetical protein
MSEFEERQVALAHTQFDDFRRGSIDLDALLKKIEGIARALGEDFWSDLIFAHALDLEQINSLIIEERRGLNKFELEYVEKIIKKIEACFAHVSD